MNNFKDISEYFLHLEKIQHNARIELSVINQKNINEFSEQDFKDKHYLVMNAHFVTLEIVKEQISKKLFDYINYLDLTLEIDIADLFMITDAIKELEFHKAQKMSDDGHEFEREIKKIKANTEQVHTLSVDKDITIRLPNTSHSINRLLLEYFKARGILSDESIKNISLFFTTRQPRSNVKSTDELYSSYSKIGDSLIDGMKKEVELNTLYHSLNDDNSIYANEIKKTEYYSPNDN